MEAQGRRQLHCHVPLDTCPAVAVLQEEALNSESSIPFQHIALYLRCLWNRVGSWMEQSSKACTLNIRKPRRKLELIQFAENTGKGAFICRTRKLTWKHAHAQCSEEDRGERRDWQSSLKIYNPRMKVLQNKGKAVTQHRVTVNSLVLV